MSTLADCTSLRYSAKRAAQSSGMKTGKEGKQRALIIRAPENLGTPAAVGSQRLGSLEILENLPLTVPFIRGRLSDCGSHKSSNLS